jgi:hypothetical protein
MLKMFILFYYYIVLQYCCCCVTGCLARLDEEKQEILNLLQSTYPGHTKQEIVEVVFPFIQNLLNLEWYLIIQNDEFVAIQTLNGEHDKENTSLFIKASRSTTFVHKDKVCVYA